MEKRLACVCCLLLSVHLWLQNRLLRFAQFPSKGRSTLICHSYLKCSSFLNLSAYSDFFFLLVCQRIYVCLFFKVLFSRDNERSQAVSTNFKS